MHIESAFPSKYLKQTDLNGRAARVTIDRLEIEDVGDGDRKLVIYFRNRDKGFVLNRTNADTISNVFGQETDDWIGRQIELYADPNVYYAGKKVGGLRVRVASAPAAAPRQAPPPPPPQHSDERAPPLEDDEIPF